MEKLGGPVIRTRPVQVTESCRGSVPEIPTDAAHKYVRS